MTATQEETIIPVHPLVIEREALSALKPYVKPQGEIAVRASELQEMKSILTGLADKAVDVVIPPEIESLKLVPPPQELAVRFAWCEERSCLERQPSEGVTYWGAGWFSDQERYWSIGAIGSWDEAWLAKEAFEGPALVELVEKILPVWRDLRIPFACDVTCSERPALSITLDEVGGESVTLRLDWNVPCEEIREISSVDDRVRVGQTIMPGVLPHKLFHIVPFEEGLHTLGLDEIPVFLKYDIPKISPWLEGQVEQLLADHYALLCPSPLEGDAGFLVNPSLSGRENETMTVGAEAAATDAEEVNDIEAPQDAQVDALAPTPPRGIEIPAAWLAPDEPIEPIEPIEPVKPIEPVEPTVRKDESPWREGDLIIGADIESSEILMELESILGDDFLAQAQASGNSSPRVETPTVPDEVPGPDLPGPSETVNAPETMAPRTGDAMVSVVLSGLEEEDRALIRWLTRNKWELEVEALQSAMPGIDVEASIRRINKRTIAVVETMLIASGSGRKIVCDEFRQALGRILL